MRRCYAEGKSKAHVSRLRGPSLGLSSEMDYSLKVLPRGLGRNLLKGVSRVDLGSLARATAIALGFATTVAGLVVETVRVTLTQRKPSQDQETK